MNWETVDIYSINELNFEDSFSLAKFTSNMSLSNEEGRAKKIIIHILEIWENIDSSTKEIWIDIIESAGFYPYLASNANMDTTSEIRRAFHSSNYLENVVFHKEQKYLSNLIEKKENIVVSAPTSFGKSLLIQEIVASKKFRNILIIQPTLALINETRLKLKHYQEYNIIVNTSQKMEQRNIFILTAERVLEYPNFPIVDYCILDEFYKVSSSRDDERSDILNIALKKVLDNNRTIFYFLGPNIDEISKGFEEQYNAKFIKTDYTLVDTKIERINIDFQSDKPRSMDKERKIRLFEMLSEKKNEQSIVYLSSPDRALKVAKEYLEYLRTNNLLAQEQQLSINEWIQENINSNWSFNKLIQQKIGVHSGTIPKHLTHSIIDYFNKGMLKVLFCTSTIIEGVNTSAKNVFIFDETKGPNKIDYFDFSNIRGRAGRLLEHYTGYVYVFHQIPEKEKIELDIPFFDQEKISDEVLINFEKKEVKSENISRFEELYDYDYDLLKVIKKNAVSVIGQKKIIENIKITLRQEPELVIWNGIPKYEALSYILNICWDNLLKDSETKKPMTRNKLPVVAYNSLMSKSTAESLNREYTYLKAKNPKWTNQRLLDQAITNYFREQRHWISYKIPKWIGVIDSLQKEVCKQMGLNNVGDYTYVASQLENEGIDSTLSILLDMGIPSSAINKLKSSVDGITDFNELVKKVKLIAHSNQNKLIEYEKNKIY
ncbi:TPA: DEAD/DEAH box helicase, partial [Listeria innocua]|nr:DEAD/DEAH box helicase [Listeria innocua]HBM4209139.1 DEAD/DEAH box helicase [Listeria innocua]